MSWVALRYFNASGADPDGEIGEDHSPEIHVIPRAIEAATGGPGLTVMIAHAVKYFGLDSRSPAVKAMLMVDGIGYAAFDWTFE